MSEKICRLCGSKPGSVCVQSSMVAKKGCRRYNSTPTMKDGWAHGGAEDCHGGNPVSGFPQVGGLEG